MHELDTLYDICEMLNRELDEYSDKVRKAGGKLSAGDLEVIDKLTHAIKSAKTTIAMIEREDEYSYDGRSYENGRGGNRGGGNRGGGSSRGNSYEGMGGMSNARGRMGGVRRDSMGRFSRDEAEDDLMDKLQEYMQLTDEPEKKQEIKRFMKKLGEM